MSMSIPMILLAPAFLAPSQHCKEMVPSQLYSRTTRLLLLAVPEILARIMATGSPCFGNHSEVEFEFSVLFQPLLSDRD
jgi:hypothetical protein